MRDRRKPVIENVVFPDNEVFDLLETLPAEDVKKILFAIRKFVKMLNVDIDSEPEPIEVSEIGKIAYKMITRSNSNYAFNRKRYNDSRSANRSKKEASKGDDDDPDHPANDDNTCQHMSTHVDTCQHVTPYDNISELSYPILSYPNPSSPTLSSSSSSSSLPAEPATKPKNDDDDDDNEEYKKVRDYAKFKDCPHALLPLTYYNEHLKSFKTEQIIRAIDRASSTGQRIVAWTYIKTALCNPEKKPEVKPAQAKVLNAQNYEQRTYTNEQISEEKKRCIEDFLYNDD